MNYDSYKAICKEKGIVNPYKTEDDFNNAYGIVIHRDKLEIKPKHRSSLDMSNAKPLKIKRSTSRIRRTRKPSVDRRPRKGNRPMVAPKISYVGMTHEEIRAHKNRLNRERIARIIPETGSIYSKLTPEQKEAYNKARIENYHANRDTILAKNKIKRANMTPEQKELATIRMRKWRASLPEDRLAEMNRRSRDARRLKREKENNASNNTTIKA